MNAAILSNQQPVNFLTKILLKAVVKKAFKILNLHFLNPNNSIYR